MPSSLLLSPSSVTAASLSHGSGPLITTASSASSTSSSSSAPSSSSSSLSVPAPSALGGKSRHRLAHSVSFGVLNAQSIGNESTVISSFIADSVLDVFLLTETRRSTSDDVALRRCTPPGYICVDVPRPSQNVAETNHGGVAAIIWRTASRWKIFWRTA